VYEGTVPANLSKAKNHVERCPQADRCGTARPVGEVESSSAEQVTEPKPRFPHFSTFRFTDILFSR